MFTGLPSWPLSSSTLARPKAQSLGNHSGFWFSPIFEFWLVPLKSMLYKANLHILEICFGNKEIWQQSEMHPRSLITNQKNVKPTFSDNVSILRCSYGMDIYICVCSILLKWLLWALTIFLLWSLCFESQTEVESQGSPNLQ